MNILQLQDVSFVAQQQTILDRIQLKIPLGSYQAVTGPSGSGKSTLLKIVATLLSPTSGRILFDGEPQEHYPVTSYRQQVSYCFQQPQLFGETVADNLYFPFIIREAKVDLAQIQQLLTQVALSEHFLDKPIIELSGGERQRVALIRNLVFMPRVLLLDEVTTGLDEESKQIVQRLIAHVHQQGVTILQVSHDEEDVALAQARILIQGGRVVSDE